MDTTIDQQVAIDEALVLTAQRLRIGRSNFLLLSDIKSKESTLQLVYDVLRICPFFKAFLPCRSFAAIINKCLTGKSSGYDSLRLSQAQILWGLYHKRNVDYAYLMWEDFVYQVEHKNQKKSNEMYYPRFTKVIIHHFMSKDPSIPRRNKFGALLPIELTNDEIRNFKVYKEYYAIATGEEAPKPKVSVRRTKSSANTSITPATAAASTDEGTGSKPGVPDVLTDESEEELSWNSTNDKGNDNEEKDDDGAEEDEGDDGEEGNGDDDDDEDDDGDKGNDDDADQEVVRDDDKDDEEEGGDAEHEFDEDESDEETRDTESFDPIPQTLKNSKDEGNGEEALGLNIGKEERHIEEEEEDELYKDVNINQGRGLPQSSSVSSQFVISLLNPTLDVGMESIFKTTSQLDVPTPTSVAPLTITTPTMTSYTIPTTTTTSQAPILPTTVPSTILQNLPNFGSLFRFDDRLRLLEENFSEFRQTNQFTRAVSSIPEIVNHYIDQRMNEAVKVAVQIQSDRLRDETQRENDKFLRTVDENMKKIIKEQVKEQVKTVTLKRRRDNDADKDEEPSAGPDRGSKRRREGKEPKSASAPTKTATRSAGRSSQGSRSRQTSTSESALAEEPMQTTSQMKEPSHSEFDAGEDNQPIVQSSQHPEWFPPQQKPPTPDHDWNKTLPAHPEWFPPQQKPPTLDRYWNKTLPTVHGSIQPWITELEKQADSRSSYNELMDTPLDFFNFLMNRLTVDTLTPELLVGPTYELMKGSCKSLIELEYHMKEVYKATTDQLDWVNPEGQQYPHNLIQPLPLIPNNRGRRVSPFEHFINNNLEYLRGGASSRKYTTSVTKTKAADYGHIKWIEDLVPRTIFAINRESARDVYSKIRIIAVTEIKIVDWHSYKHLDWITNKDKRNRLMRIDELHKFSDGMLTDVRTALDDRLKGIRMQYLSQLIWRKSDKDRAATMIQAIDKRLKTRRIMRSLEQFVGGRLYEGDFRM
nr:hypothetical protein [Tanacetum cinerariifolium]